MNDNPDNGITQVARLTLYVYDYGDTGKFFVKLGTDGTRRLTDAENIQLLRMAAQLLEEEGSS